MNFYFWIYCLLNISSDCFICDNWRRKSQVHSCLFSGYNNKIVVLSKSQLNSIENLISKALIDLEIGHEEFKTTVNEKEKYGRMEENIRMMKISDELGENNKSIRENRGKALKFLFKIFLHV